MGGRPTKRWGGLRVCSIPPFELRARFRGIAIRFLACRGEIPCFRAEHGCRPAGHRSEHARLASGTCFEWRRSGCIGEGKKQVVEKHGARGRNLGIAGNRGRGDPRQGRTRTTQGVLFAPRCKYPCPQVLDPNCSDRRRVPRRVWSGEHSGSIDWGLPANTPSSASRTAAGRQTRAVTLQDVIPVGVMRGIADHRHPVL